MKIFLYVLICLSSDTALSQKVVDVEKSNLPTSTNLYYTVAGEPVNNTKYVRVVDGSPFFYDSWLMGKIILSEGVVYDSMKLRLDLMDNTVHYIESSKGEELIAATPLKSIWLEDPVSMKKYQFDYSDFIQVTRKIEPGWYQLLDSGVTTLYKQYIKSINENKPYGSATYEQTIITSLQYYILLNNVLTPFKGTKQLIDLLKDKKNELTTFVNAKKISGKSEEGYVNVVSYYNNLITK